MLLAVLLILSAEASTLDIKKLVPGGTEISRDNGEIKVKTTAGTVIELSMDADGELEEASGSAVLKGDVFEPGAGQLSLAQASEGLKKSGKTPQGEWTFEENENGDWIYDFEGTENKKAVDYIVNATNGKLLKTEIDD
jgi:hypothetical protein